MKIKNGKRYGFEFLLIFTAVIGAFALNSWNENRKSKTAESKLLTEIHSGLQKDLLDMESNVWGHQHGNNAVDYFRKFLAQKPIDQDSLVPYYFSLTRDFISVQNTSGYETLKSRGFELIQDDSLRSQIIALYEYEYSTLRKLEEEYYENQFHQNYYHKINETLAKGFVFTPEGKIVGIDTTKKIEENEKRLVLSYLWKIKANRTFTLAQYEVAKLKVEELSKSISAYTQNQ